MGEIPIKYNNNTYYLILDKDDYDLFKNTKFHIQDEYAFNSRFGKLHRYLVDAKPNQIVHHINENKLDNRRSNLRICTRGEYARLLLKSKKYHGVSYNSKRNVWVVTYNYTMYYFKKEDHAGYWYDLLVLENMENSYPLNNIPKPDDFVRP